MTDYLLHPSFLKKPIPTQIAIVKCCERFTKGRPKSVHVIEKGNVPLKNLHLECGPWNKHPMSTQMSTKFLMIILVHGMLFKILENDNTEESVKEAVAKALIRTLAPRKMPKGIFRLAAFQCGGPSICNKIVKYLKKVSKYSVTGSLRDKTQRLTHFKGLITCRMVITCSSYCCTNGTENIPI